MPRGPRNKHTRSTAENSTAYGDGVQCASCKSTNTKVRFVQVKKETRRAYHCLNSECSIKLWVERGPTRAPNNTRSGAMSNPVVADAAPQPPPPTAAISESQQ